MKFHFRIIGLFLIIIFISLAVLGIFMGRLLEQAHIDTLEDRIGKEARILIRLIDEKQMMDHPADFQRSMASYAREIADRITVIDPSGKVLVDTEENPAVMENHLNRPEVKQALERGYGKAIRYSNTLGYEMLYVSVLMTDINGRAVGVLRISEPIQMIDKEVNSWWFSLLAAILILFVLTALAGNRFTREITQPIEEITNVARKLSLNKYETRMKNIPKGDIGQLASAINTMADNLERQMEKIRENEQRLSGILTQMGSGVLLIGENRKINLANRATEQLLDVRANQIIGKPHIEVGKSIGLSRLIEKCFETGEAIREEVYLYYPGERILDAHLAPNMDEHNKVIGVITVLHDITEIRRLERMRSEFVANVSHELRTPITAVKGFAETLLDGALKDEKTATSFLKIIYDESDRLHRLINDILDLSKMEQRNLPLAVEKLDLVRLVKETAEMLKILMKEKSLTFHEPTGEDEVYMEGDRHRIQQIIVNLMTNAIHYTPEGGHIRIDAANAGDNVLLKVSDTGIGISEKELPRIFERFYRVDRARSRHSGGTGLGLSIVKHLVEMHHGSISVESKSGVGTTFAITFPKQFTFS